MEPLRKPDRSAELNDRAARRLVTAHARDMEERLVLAVRYGVDLKDIFLLEVLEGFPGGADEKPLTTEFNPSPELLLLGTLHLTLVSPEQLRTAVARNDELIHAIRRDGRIEYRASDAADLVQLLGVDSMLSSGEKRARLELLEQMAPEDRATAEEMEEIRRRWRE
jgi:hypothetical protein